MKYILLLEDDLSAALDIELIVNELGDMEITQVSNIKDAEKAYLKRQPDAIIADLHLDNAENSLDWLQTKTSSIPVIILTNNYSDDYYQKAKLINARAYLMKPVNTVTLKYELERMLIGQSTPDQKVVIKDGSKLHALDSSELIWVRTEGNYSTIQTVNKKIVIKTSLLKIINQLNPQNFIRTHRSAVVAMGRIKMIDGSTESVLMSDGSKIPLGKTYKSEVKRRLSNYGNLFK